MVSQAVNTAVVGLMPLWAKKYLMFLFSLSVSGNEARPGVEKSAESGERKCSRLNAVHRAKL